MSTSSCRPRRAVVGPRRPVRRAPRTERRRLAAVLYGYSFLDEFILLYPVYALLFADTGLSTAQISSLFALWSITGLVLEVPSGAWADAVSRRLLLIIGPLFAAVGYTLWIAQPSYWAFALGFVLWGVRGALTSGALEALVYEELDRLGAADRYATVLGRARAAGLVAVLAGIAAAGPVFAAGGYPAVGAASVLVCLLGAVAGTAFPEHRSRVGPAAVDPAADDSRTGPENDGKVNGPDEDEPSGGHLAVLRVGLIQARHDRRVRAALLLVPAVTGIWGALDEYVPLLARETGVPAQTVPLLVLLVTVGGTAGGLLAGPAARLGVRPLAALLAGAAVALALGAAGQLATGFVLLAVAFGIFQLASVVVDARLQERITGPARATVTSLAGLATELVTLGVFAGYAAMSGTTTHGVIFALFALPYLGVALVLWHTGGYGRRTAGTGPQPAGNPEEILHR